MRKAKAERVFAAVREHFEAQGYEVPEWGWIFRDHTHEELLPGAWSLGCEEHLEYNWTVTFVEDCFKGGGRGLFSGRALWWYLCGIPTPSGIEVIRWLCAHILVVFMYAYPFMER